VSGAGGLLTGVIALSTLELVLSSAPANTAFQKLLTVPASLFDKFVSPAYGLIPDLSGTGTAATSSLLQSAPSSTGVLASTTTATEPSSSVDVASLPPASTPSTLV
jgi:hypothetical protein